MENVDYTKIQSAASPRLRKLSMGILATLPMLAWYKIPFPVGLGYALVLFLSAYTIFIRNFKVNVFGPLFWCLFVFVCFMWTYNNGFGLWTLIPPGGWQFFLFFLALIWGVLNFDMQLLLKYMKWVVLISALLFWIQLVLKLTTGSQAVCFVPNLTGAFTYEEMTYSELAARQMEGERPCSIFLEASYMAYYYVTYLALNWFCNDKWMNKELGLTMISLIALRSGSGMIGLAVVIVAKLFSMFWTSRLSRRLLLIVTAIPLLVGTVYLYLGTEIGQKMSSRTDEFTTEGTSGFTRVVGGYLMFDQLNPNEKLIGIPDASDRFGIDRANGEHKFFVNGVQAILLSLGYVGAALYLIFYAGLFRKVGSASRMSIIVLLVMGLLESNYLNPYMMLLTIIPCADWYYHKKNIIVI